MKHLLLTMLLLTSSAFANVDPRRFDRLDNSNDKFDINIYDEIHGQRQGFVPVGPIKERGRGLLIPMNMSKNDVLKIVAATSLAVVFFANDKEISDFAHKNDAEFVDKLAYFGEAFGSEWGIGAVGAGYILGVVMKNNQVKSVSIMAAKAMIVSGLATQAIKHAVDRTRPKNSDSPYEVGAGSRSFPSGHTTQAFALATVIAETTKDQGMVIPVIAYTAAAIAGWSRVHDKAHWASDVVIGALIGHLTAKSVMNSKLTQKGILIAPEVDYYGNAGFRVSYIGKPQKMKCGEGMQDVDAFRDCIQRSFQTNYPIRAY